MEHQGCQRPGGRPETDSPAGPMRRRTPFDTLILDVQPPEPREKCLLLYAARLAVLLQQARPHCWCSLATRGPWLPHWTAQIWGIFISTHSSTGRCCSTACLFKTEAKISGPIFRKSQLCGASPSSCSILPIPPGPVLQKGGSHPHLLVTYLFCRSEVSPHLQVSLPRASHIHSAQTNATLKFINHLLVT